MLMRRCDHTNIGRQGAVASNTLERTLLQHTQYFHLHVKWHIANFIQEQGASLCHLETPYPSRNSTRERAFFMTEEFAFQQFRRNGAAVNGHKGLVAA